MRKTPTQRILGCLEVYKDKGLRFVCQGGEGFVLPRYWIFKWNGKDVCCTKTKHLRRLLNKIKEEENEVEN